MGIFIGNALTFIARDRTVQVQQQQCVVKAQSQRAHHAEQRCGRLAGQLGELREALEKGRELQVGRRGRGGGL